MHPLEDAVPLGDIVCIVHRVTDRATGASWTGALALRFRDGLAKDGPCKMLPKA